MTDVRLSSIYVKYLIRENINGRIEFTCRDAGFSMCVVHDHFIHDLLNKAGSQLQFTAWIF